MEKKTIVIFSEEEQESINEVYLNAACSAVSHPSVDKLIEACEFDDDYKVISAPDNDNDWQELYNEVLYPMAEIDFREGNLEDDVAEEAWSVDFDAWNSEDNFEEVTKLYSKAGAFDIQGDKLKKLIAICCNHGW